MKPASAQGYRVLRQALIERFQPSCQVESYKALLRTRVRKPDEELQNLAEEVSRLVRLSYPNADGGTVDTVAKDRFIECLEDAELRHWIYQKDPENLTAAVQRGVQAEAYLKSERNKTHRVRGSSKTMAEEMEGLKASITDFTSGKLNTWMTDISKKLDRPQAPPTQGQNSARKNQEKKLCFECQSEEHFRRDCAQYKARVEKAKAAGVAKTGESGN